MSPYFLPLVTALVVSRGGFVVLGLRHAVRHG